MAISNDIDKLKSWLNHTLAWLNIDQTTGSMQRPFQQMLELMQRAREENRPNEVWEIIGQLEELTTQASIQEQGEIFLYCAKMAVELENLKEAGRFCSAAESKFRSYPHQHGVSLWMFGCIQWVVLQRVKAISSWREAIQIFKARQASLALNTNRVAWYNQILPKLENYLEVAIENDNLPNYDLNDNLVYYEEKITNISGRALSDNPTYEKDFLGYKDYVKAIANFIESHETEKPLTIGIDAPWGGGKTSLMRMLEKRLQGLESKRWRWPWEKEEHFYTVWFDAWQYDQEETLWAALVLEIWSQVQERVNFFQRIKLSINLNWKRIDWPKLGLDILKSLLFALSLISFVIAGFIGLSLLLGSSLQSTLDWLRQYTKVFAGIGLISITYTVFKDITGILLSPFSLGISQYIQKPNYVDKIGFIGQFEKDFKYVIETITKNGKWPLVVFIDDLDRCTPAKVTEIIEAINLLLVSKHCVFIIGMDSSMLAKCVQAKYKDLQAIYGRYEGGSDTGLGRYFLEKIIQIDFRIPPADISHITNFIKSQLGQAVESDGLMSQNNSAESLIEAELRTGKSYEEAKQEVSQTRPDLSDQVDQALISVSNRSFENHPEVEKSVQFAAPYLNFNPRKIKRFINIFRLQALIAHERGLLESTISLDKLAKWILLNICWPEIVSETTKRPSFLVDYLSEMNQIFYAKAKQKRALLEELKDSSTFSKDLLSFIMNEQLRSLLNSIPTSVNDVRNYLHLIQTTP